MMAKDGYLDSEILSSLRTFLEYYPTLRELIGSIAQYRIVLDANAAVADLLHKHTYPHIQQTALEEAVKSSAIELHAPAWLDTEIVASAIPQVSKHKGIPEITLQSLWSEYRKQIIWDDKIQAPGDVEVSGDLKDAPYVALQRSISAVAILSRDRDMDDLGGRRVELEFVLSVRTYARAASYAVGIRIGGIFVATIGIELLVQIARLISFSISLLPPSAKIALIAGVAFVVMHPQSRERAFALLKGLGEQVVALWPDIERLIELAADKQLEAETALSESKRLLGP